MRLPGGTSHIRLEHLYKKVETETEMQRKSYEDR